MTPPEVLAATDSYRDESDPLKDYRDQRLIVAPNTKIARGDLWSDYEIFCRQAREPLPLSQHALYNAVRRIPGVEERQWKPTGQTTPLRGFAGVGLVWATGPEGSR